MRLRFAGSILALILALVFFLLATFLPADFAPTKSMDVSLDDDHSATAAKTDAFSTTAELLRYFGLDNSSSDAALVTWAHAVNSNGAFRDAVAAGIHFFEADVLLRESGSGFNETPIMAHPPATDSDLTLREFLKMSLSLRIGIKLDFKTVEALRGSVDVLAEFQRRRIERVASTHLWMNADIVGHGAVKRGKVEADDFLNVTRRVTPDATLSVGWNIAAEYFTTVDVVETNPTAVAPAALTEEAPTTISSLRMAYADADVERMRDALLRNGVSTLASITFAVWSKFIPNSLNALGWLTAQFPRSTVTVWGKEADATVERVKTIYDVLPRSRVFIDLPEVMRNGL